MMPDKDPSQMYPDSAGMSIDYGLNGSFFLLLGLICWWTRGVVMVSCLVITGFIAFSKKGVCSLEKVQDSLACPFLGQQWAPTFFKQCRNTTKKDNTRHKKIGLSLHGLFSLAKIPFTAAFEASLLSYFAGCFDSIVSNYRTSRHCKLASTSQCWIMGLWFMIVLFHVSSHVHFVILQDCCRPPRWWVSFGPKNAVLLQERLGSRSLISLLRMSTYLVGYQVQNSKSTRNHQHPK